MNSLKGVLIDVTGVLYESGTKVPIPGSVEAISKLRKAKIPFRIVTNESQTTSVGFVKKLHALGYNDLVQSEIFRTAPAAVHYMREHKLKPYLVVHPNLTSEFDEFLAAKDDVPPNCVVVGTADEYFTFERLNKAFNLLHGMTQPKLLALGSSRYYKHVDQLKLGVGSFVEALRFAVGGDRLKPILFGKPSPTYFNAAVSDLKLNANEVAMIGDDVISDVVGAIRCGLRGVLVRTGKYTPGDELGKERPPDAVVDNFHGAVDLVLDSVNK